ncbi:MAG: sulfatase-like hydrolase/transferase [Pirellulaceae bacterium]|nr:sulfatase-like hydrolase/transferase [Pirellulaceae bacterium]
MQPNIIFIITDQQRFDTIAELGYQYMDTPNLDRLVREGVTFENCFITAASCAPARASLFTGHYPHTTGILRNGDRWTKGWTTDLQKAGYHTVNVGKMHTWPHHTPMGFDQRYVVENKDRYLEARWFFDEWDKALRARGLVKQQRELYRKRSDYRESLGAFEWLLDEDMHPDMFVGDLAVWWLKNYPLTQPLFLEIGFPGPHPPYDPIPRYTQRYLDQDDLNILPVTAEELEAQPQPLKGMRVHNTEVDHDSVHFLMNPTPQQRHRQRAFYHANVTMIDEKIGEILNTLEATGYAENTIVIFTSDHGDCLTDHGHSQKWTMYDIITKVPTIVWSPSLIEGGRKVQGMCQQFDLGATILELAGATIDYPMAARSLLPVLTNQQGDSEPLRDIVFAEQARDGNLTETDLMTMVRTKNWKLVHFLEESFGQLFDLHNDPHEVHNLWDSPEFAVVKTELLDKLREWRMRDGFNNAELWKNVR